MQRVIGLLLLAACSPSRTETGVAKLGDVGSDSDEPRRHVVAVGSQPVALVASPDGRVVVSVNDPATVSLIDVRAHREVLRVEARLNSPEDFLIDVAFDAQAKTAWIVSCDGEIFSLDLDSHVLRSRFRSDKPLDLRAVTWDARRSRLLVGDDHGRIHSLVGGALHEVLAFDKMIADLKVSADVLLFTTNEGSSFGVGDSYFCAYDLAANNWLFTQSFRDHDFRELSVAGERVWVADSGGSRLLEFAVHGGLLATRYLSAMRYGPYGPGGGELEATVSLRAPEFHISYVAASHARVVVASNERSTWRILEYRRGHGGFASLPAAQYTLSGTCAALCLVGKWGLAAGVGDDVVLIPNVDAQPFAPKRDR